MTSCNLGSRSRRAAVLGLFCVCAFVTHIDHSFAQEEMPLGDSMDGPVASDEAIGPMTFDNGMPCDYGCGDYDCYGGCDGCSPCYGCSPYDDCGTCGPPCNSRRCSGWFGAEYLRWRIEGNRLPPLVTESPSSTPLSMAARLDEPTTEILSGHSHENDDWRNGYRLFGGFWLDCCHTCGIGVDYFELGNDDYNFTSPQDTIITGRPFYNMQTGMDDAELVSVPNQLDGTAHVRSTDDFKGAGLTFNRSLWRCCNPCNGVSCGLTMLGGYRFYRYDTNLSVTENLTVLPGTTSPLVPGTTIYLQDRFRTRNDFNGGEIGIQAYKQRCWWWVDGMAKVAMGQQVRTVDITGQTFVDVPGGGTALNQGGLLTSEVTNIGRYRNTDFVFIPEFRLGIGACVTKCCSVRCGYDLIFWGDVARAAEQLPPGLAVDPRNLPPIQAGGGAAPEFAGIHGSQLVAHGFDASVQFQW